MKIAFHLYHFTFRGTEVATFDYAIYNRLILDNISIIVTPKDQKPPDRNAIEKFGREFPIFYYNNIEDLESICREEKVDALYVLKYGKNDGLFLKSTPTWVHCVFTTEEPHGDIYAGVSKSVSKKNNNDTTYPVVNHVVYLPDIKSDYRRALNIPQEDIVLGRHGGTDTFNIPFVKEVIVKVLKERKDIWFLFAVRPDMLSDFTHPRVIYLESFTDVRVKRKFINTCDAMIHASTLGESFGLSVLEFSFCNKPTITWNGGLWHKQHLENLGDKAITYNNESELLSILKSIDKKSLQQKYYNVTRDYTAEKIMKQFEDVFIKSSGITL